MKENKPKKRFIITHKVSRTPPIINSGVAKLTTYASTVKRIDSRYYGGIELMCKYKKELDEFLKNLAESCENGC